MKVLDLSCQQDHAFEGWFGSEADFQQQLARGQVQCPLCASAQVRKVLSAPRLNLGAHRPAGADGRDALGQATPSVPHTAPQEGARPEHLPALPPGAGAAPPAAALQAAWLQQLRRLAAQSEDVGRGFADEARRMHQGEVPERAIRGQASAQETRALLEEGIAVLPLPPAASETLQ